MEYIEITVSAEAEREDELTAFLACLDIFSYEIVAKNMRDDLNRNKNDWDFVDEKFFENLEDKLKLRIYMDVSEKERADLLISKLRESGYEVDETMLDDSGAQSEWKKYFKPLEIGNEIAVVPVWENYDNKDGRKVVKIDPGMAFGTGSHETTSMCIRLIEKYMKKGFKILDVGSGSGILSIVSEKLGASSALGLDIDPMCVENSKQHAELNDCEKTKFVQGDLAANVKDEKFDLVVSNIIAQIIVGLTVDLPRLLNTGGTFICSGIIEKYESLVLEALERQNFTVIEKISENGWVAIAARMR